MKLQMVCFILFLSVFYIADFVLLGNGLRMARRSVEPRAWPTAQATLSTLEVVKNSDGDSTTYEVKVRYDSTVEGVAHEGSCLAFGYGGSSSKESHDEICQRIKEAKAVAVRYDPSDPSISCLSFGIHQGIQVLLMFAVGYLSFIIGFTVILWLSTRPDSVLLDNLSLQ